MHEDFRREKVRGFESSFMPGGLLLLDRLYRHCRDEGWQPLIVSASEEIQLLHQAVGCRAADFALTECLFILRPFDAARRTPNLTVKQRLAVFLVGAAQQSRSWVRFIFGYSPGDVKLTTVDSICVHPTKNQIAFFEDKPSLAWRYPNEEYVTVSSERDPHRYVIAKHGSGERYLRVCQWDLGDAGDPERFILALVQQAEKEKALGVRWSVYGDRKDLGLLRAMRKFGFVQAPRNRRLLFHAGDDLFLKPEAWNFTDSFFCFDL